MVQANAGEASEFHPMVKLPGAQFLMGTDYAEQFAADPKNHPVYLGDVAHKCKLCDFWHLSKPEWLVPEWPTVTGKTVN